MIRFLKAIVLALVFATTTFAVCPSPRPEDLSKPVFRLSFNAKGPDAPGEFVLTARIASPGASWRRSGAEAAVVTVFVDGIYNQDIVLFGGAEPFDYEAPIGSFGAGRHRVAIYLNEKQSAAGSRVAKVLSAAVRPASDSVAVANAPFIYLRPDTIGRFSDVPLLSYYERVTTAAGDLLRYTTIFTNEDGGTQSAALMARWGRMTDIEWVHETVPGDDRKPVSSGWYQGANHVRAEFRGEFFGRHPLYLDATVNNNFADAGCSALRVSPKLVAADLAAASRETVMDANPWTYRVMADEAFREGRVDPARLGANVIDDPRRYAYVEVESGKPENAAVAVAVKGPDGSESRSDNGSQWLRVDRPGFVRIAVRMPWADTDATSFPKSVELLCESVRPGQPARCGNARIRAVVMLDAVFRPIVRRVEASSKELAAGERAAFSVN